MNIVYALLSAFYAKLVHVVEANMTTRETCHSSQRFSMGWTHESASFHGR